MILVCHQFIWLITSYPRWSTEHRDQGKNKRKKRECTDSLVTPRELYLVHMNKQCIKYCRVYDYYYYIIINIILLSLYTILMCSITIISATITITIAIIIVRDQYHLHNYRYCHHHRLHYPSFLHFSPKVAFENVT